MPDANARLTVRGRQLVAMRYPLMAKNAYSPSL